MPTSEIPHPHWKTAVRMPNAASAVSRLVTAAWSGIRSERKATSSTSMLSSRMVMITSGSRLAISEARSTLLAVEPPTNATTPLPVFGGITEERRWRTRSAVLGSAGAVVAITV